MVDAMDIPDWKKHAAAEYRARREVLARKLQRSLKTRSKLDQNIAAAEAEIARLDQGAETFDLPVTWDRPLFEAHPATPSTPPAGRAALRDAIGALAPAAPAFKDLALKYLADAYPASLKAAQIQAMGERDIGRKLHWKTAGMTLYRLKTEGKARRTGQNWFFVTPEDRQKIDELAEAFAREPTLADLLDEDPADVGGVA